MPGSWSCEDSVPCPLVSEASCQLHSSCLMTHMGIPFLTPCRPTSQVVPCSQRLHGQELDWTCQTQLRRGTGVAGSRCPPTTVTLLIISTVGLGNLQASEVYKHVPVTRARLKGVNVSAIPVLLGPHPSLTSGHARYWAMGWHVSVPLSKAGSAQKGRGRTGLSAMQGPHDPPVVQPWARQRTQGP